MEENTDYNRKQEDLTWLENLQRNSWEPEVIISGITLAFLFIFPTKIYEFSVFLIQEIGTGYIASWLILIYLTTIVSVFKIFFVVHLALRFVWTGLLGLSYAFPKGVIDGRLFKNGQGYKYQSPNEMVLKLERICSMTFAFPVSMVITFLLLTVYLGLLIFIYVWFDLPFIIICLLILVTVIGLSLSLLYNKKTKFKRWYTGSILSSIGAVYQSNLGKWFTVGYATFIFLCATPIIMTDVEDFSMFVNDTNLIPKELEWPSKAHIYEEHHAQEKRYPRAFIPTELITDELLQVGVARYEEDGQMLAHIQEKFSDQLHTIGWGEVKEPSDLLQLYIDGSLVEEITWRKIRLPITGQKVYQSLHFLDSLPAGTHTLHIEKLIIKYDFVSNEPQLKKLENWAKFEFIKK